MSRPWDDLWQVSSINFSKADCIDYHEVRLLFGTIIGNGDKNPIIFRFGLWVSDEKHLTGVVIFSVPDNILGVVTNILFD